MKKYHCTYHSITVSRSIRLPSPVEYNSVEPTSHHKAPGVNLKGINEGLVTPRHTENKTHDRAAHDVYYDNDDDIPIPHKKQQDIGLYNSTDPHGW